MSNRSKSKLNELSSGNVPPEADTTPRNAGPVFLIYRGRAGQDGEFEHVGPVSFCVPGGSAFMLMPGLFILDDADGAAWPANKVHPPIAALMLDDGEHGAQLKVSSPELRGYMGDSLRGLAQRTKQPAALEHILQRELAKPISANRKTRRDVELCESLERRLVGARQRPQLDVRDIPKAAQAVARGSSAAS